MKKQKQINCPSCKSKKIAKFLYGMPAFSKKLEKELEQGKVKLGGCCISDESPQFHCNDCGNEWNDMDRDN